MRFHIKKILFSAVVLTVLMFVMSNGASAANYTGNCGVDGDNISFTLDTETGVLEFDGYGSMKSYIDSKPLWKKYSSSIKTVIFSTEIENIGYGSFSNCDQITCVVLPEQLISIDSFAFSFCKSLSNILIPENVEVIDNYAFYQSGITEITIPDSVEIIGDNAFYACENLLKVDFGKRITRIGESAFNSCDRLREIEIPFMVEHIGAYAFSRCNGIKEFVVDNNNEYFSCDQYGVLFNKDKTKLIQYPADSSKMFYTVPNTVVNIAAWSFNDCDNLTDITMSDSVESIDYSAFNSCDNLINVIMSKNIKNIDSGVFCWCKNIEHIEIPKDITIISREMFRGCEKLKTIILPNGLTCIDAYAFEDCINLENIIFPDTLTDISNSAFQNCVNLQSIKMTNSVKKIGFDAFAGCTNLKELNFVGTKEQWESISVGSNNSSLYGATKKFICPHEKVISVEQVEPTCIEKGYTAGEKCAYCNKWLTGHKEIPIISCIPSQVYEENKVDALCEVKGYYDEVIYCLVCKKELSRINKDIAEYGHTEIIIDEVAAGCNKGGLSRGKYCDVCGKILVAQTETSTLGHTKVTDKAVPSTCTETGLTEGSHCSVCKAVIKKQETIAKKAHTYTITSTIKATLKKNGKTVSKCNGCRDEKATVIYYPKTIKLSATTFSYNGKTKTPSVIVKDSKGNALKNGTDYTVTYPKKRKSIGKYTITVTFKGNYSGTKKLTFEIVPAKVTLSKLTSGTKQLTATWKTVSGATGYEVAYSTSSKFTSKTTKKVTIKKAKTTKTTVKKLKKGKKYYVKVRAYKTVDGKKIYGAWSAVKSVKVK